MFCRRIANEHSPANSGFAAAMLYLCRLHGVIVLSGVVVEVGWLASAKSACNSRKNVSKVSNGSSLTLDTPSPSSEGTLDAVGAPTKALSSIAENSTDCAALFS